MTFVGCQDQVVVILSCLPLGISCGLQDQTELSSAPRSLWVSGVVTTTYWHLPCPVESRCSHIVVGQAVLCDIRVSPVLNSSTESSLCYLETACSLLPDEKGARNQSFLQGVDFVSSSLSPPYLSIPFISVRKIKS